MIATLTVIIITGDIKDTTTTGSILALLFCSFFMHEERSILGDFISRLDK